MLRVTVKWCVLVAAVFLGPFLLVTGTLNASSAASNYMCYEPIPGLPLLPVEGMEECKTPDPAPRVARPFWKRCVTGLACARAVLPHFFKRWRYALEIVRCETGGTFSNRALGKAGERGWLQIHPWWWHDYRWIQENRLWDVRYNARVAAWIVSSQGGWSHWACAHGRASWSN